MAYIEFRDLGVEYSDAGRAFTCFAATRTGRLAPFWENVRAAAFRAGGKVFSPAAYAVCRCATDPDVLFHYPHANMVWHCSFAFSEGPAEAPEAKLDIALTNNLVEFSVEGPELLLQGHASWNDAPVSELIPLRSEGGSAALHGSCGPAVPEGADMLYDRQSDSAVRFDGKALFSFDWEANAYLLEAEVAENAPLRVTFEEGMGRKLFALKHWKGISHAHGFDTPPAGWMTWYAVRFDACEKVVLENARAMKELFGKFDEKLCVWVDWEWCHRRLYDHGDPGVDVFHPRKDAYPHGLLYLSEKIRKMGLRPALWTGCTCDGNRNEMFRKIPGLLLTELQTWGGYYWLDLSHPAAAKEYVPKVFKKILDWGYDIIKWDCLLNTMRINDEERARRYDPGLSTDEAIHRCIAAARKVIGDKAYLLGCTGQERSVLAAPDLFDACRIGGDVFSWDDFKSNAVALIYSYFPLHNTSLFLDPDTLVLRKEYSTLEQARSRITFFSLTGMQLTLGDPVAELDPPRIDALKRAMPTVEIRPTEFVRKTFSGDVAVIVTSVAKASGGWHVAGVFNLGKRKRKVTLDLNRDLGLPEKDHTAFEFWSRSFAEVKKGRLTVELPPGGCAAFRLTPVEKAPFVAGSTRHLLQGAVELTKWGYDPEKELLSGTAELVAGDETELWFRAPEGFRFAPQKNLTIAGQTAKLTLKPLRSGPCRWKVVCGKA